MMKNTSPQSITRTEYQFSNQAIKSQHLWRNDITGLRALAVIPVLLYHAFPGLVPGGFFGVDVFFVISGYLISGIIFRSLSKDQFSYVDFYEKRIKRIVPNLVFVLLVTLLFGWFFLFSSEFASLGKHVLASSFFAQNFNLLSESGYFTEDALRMPLLHLWSLAIEEQFYIVFPIFATLIWKVWNSPKVMGVGVLGIVIISFTMCLVLKDQTFRFYFPLTRFWEIGFGILVAYIESFNLFSFRKVNKPLRSFLSFFSVLLLVFSFLFVDKNLHPGFVTLIPVLAATFIIIAGPDALINSSLLSSKVMTFIGLISYSLYLWHWPILSYLFICLPMASWLLKLAALGLSFLVATTVYYYIENPLRRVSWRFCNKWPLSTVLLFGLVTVSLFGVMVKQFDGFAFRNFNQKFESMSTIRQWIDWKKEKKIFYQGAPIYVSSKLEVPEILLVGDSHAEMYWPRLKELSLANEKNAGIFWASGCFVFASSFKSTKACELNQKAFYKILESNNVKTLIITNKWGGRLWLKDEFDKSLIKLLKYTKEKNIKLYVILDAPWDEGPRGTQASFDPLKHFNRFSSGTEHLESAPPDDSRWKSGNNRVKNIYVNSHAVILDPYEYVCPDDRCNLNIWRDDDHLRPVWLKDNGVWLDKVVE